MLGRMAILATMMVLAGCAGFEPAGRNAVRAPAPPASVETAAPETVAPPPVLVPAPAPVAAPQVSVPTPTPAAVPSDDDEIVVPGQVQSQVPPPRGDPRNRIERREDIRAWDQCVSQAQAIFETDPMSPQLDSPEDVCSSALGMANRDAVPESRRRR